MMRYSVQLRDQVFVNRDGFFLKIWVKVLLKI